MPIATGTAARCVSVLTLTDFDDVGPFFAEAARILRPDGQLVVITTHPCFIGPFAKAEGGSDGTIHNKLIRAGLHLLYVEEPGGSTTPWLLSLVASTQPVVSGSA